MQTTRELLDDLNDSILDFETDLLMFRLLDMCRDVPASVEVINDYKDRVSCYLCQHSTDIVTLASALSQCLEPAENPTHIQAIA